jgi:Skp1 family, dimerisation domain
LTVLAVSILIKGKSAAELREIFNVTNDGTEGEGGEAAAAIDDNN